MQAQWTTVPIKELYEGLYDGPHATPKTSDEGPVFLGIKNLTDDGHLDLAEIRHIAEEDFVTWTRRIEPRPGDIVFTYEATLNRYAIIPEGFRGCLGRRMALIRADPRKVDTRFLFYYFFSPAWREVITNNMMSGATVDRIPLVTFPNFPVSAPPLSIQRRLAGVLSAYDDLAENSQRRIRNLEDMARALYREWFVHFRVPGHEKLPRVASPLGDIPRGWEVKQVKDVAKVTYGFPFQSNKFNTTGAGTPVIRIRDILEGSIDTFTDEEAEPKYHIKNGDILVGMDGDFHMCMWSSGHAFQNQRVAKFESSSEIGNYHLFLALELPIQTWNKSIVGTTVAHLGDMHIKTIQIAWPPAKLLAKAREILEPMSEQIITLKRQIKNLRRTRDLLLPRLLSGQVEMSSQA
jgi:type I restriction enzyme S subunit